VKKQPNSEQCFVCGLRNPLGLKLVFHDDGVGEVRCETSVPEAFQGYPGIVHGGIVASILDEVVGRVAMIADPNHFLMTVKMEVKYRQPVPVATPLVIVGRSVETRGKLTQTVGELRLPDGSLAASATATLIDLPERHRVDGNLDALGWKVYP
jgi:acyl-coenzyme A thioesterase PaaI-like protein